MALARDSAEARRRVRIVTLASGSVLERVFRRHADIKVVRSRDVLELHARLREFQTSLIVVDPADLRDESFLEVVAHAASSGVPLLLHCELTASTASRVARAARIMPVELVLHGAEREAEIINRVLIAGGRQTASSLLFSRLSDCVPALPERCGERFVSLFGWLRIARSVGEFIRSIGVDETTVRAWMRRAGLSTPSCILNCARVAQTYTYLLDSGCLVGEAAERLEWPSRTMRSQFADLLGVSALDASAAMEPDEVARRLSARARFSVK
jgi:hypothetical protein